MKLAEQILLRFVRTASQVRVLVSSP